MGISRAVAGGGYVLGGAGGRCDIAARMLGGASCSQGFTTTSAPCARARLARSFALMLARFFSR